VLAAGALAAVAGARPAAAQGAARAAAVAAGAALAVAPARAALPSSALGVRDGAAWRVWWRAERAPTRWDAGAVRAAGLAGAVRWRASAPGVERATLALSGSGEAWRTDLVLVRVDPRRAALRLHAQRDADGRVRAWRVDDAPAGAAVAFNAGQFDGGGPWGWVVHEGAEWRRPGRGPLAPAVVVDTAGRVRLVPADSLDAVRAGGAVREAFQSYPALLLGDGEVPEALRAPGRGVDLAHRDARLALGVLPDGRVLLALTRFGALAGALDALPFGPTVPEMAGLLGALGARQAVLLDGGMSGQLLVREGGRTRAWRGVRPVPLGVTVVPR
jgi:hypothetical protein